MSELIKNIHEAVNAVMKDVGYVQKQKGGNLNYTYAGEAALIQAVRPSMVEHGIYMYVSKINKIDREQYTTAKGTPMVNTVIHGTIRFTHISGDSIDVDAVGEGSDAGDKSANKAMTGMYKYAIRQTFNIETGDDPDKFSSDEQERPPLQLKNKPAPEKKIPPVATTIQTLRVEYGKVFAKAQGMGFKDLPILNGKSTAQEITEAIKKVDALIASVESLETEAQDVSAN